MTKILTWTIAVIFLTPVVLGFAFIFLLIDAMTLRLVWNWIAVPGLGLKFMGLPLAFGVGILLQTLKGGRMVCHKKQDNKENLEAMRNYCISTLFLLVAAFLINKFYLGV